MGVLGDPNLLLVGNGEFLNDRTFLLAAGNGDFSRRNAPSVCCRFLLVGKGDPHSFGILSGASSFSVSFRPLSHDGSFVTASSSKVGLNAGTSDDWYLLAFLFLFFHENVRVGVASVLGCLGFVLASAPFTRFLLVLSSSLILRVRQGGLMLLLPTVAFGSAGTAVRDVWPRSRVRGRWIDIEMPGLATAQSV